MTTAIDLGTVTRAIEALLGDDARFQQTMVSRGEPLNDDPANCPWIGVYRKDQNYDPRTLGAGAGSREFKGDLIIIAQETSLSSGAECEDLLDALVDNIISAILTDANVRATVDMIPSVNVSYSYDSFDTSAEDYTNYFQTAFITVSVEARTS